MYTQRPSVNPYGHQAPPSSAAVGGNRFLAFGLTYLIGRGAMVALITVLLLIVAAAFLPMGFGDRLAIVFLILFAWIGYVIAASIMAIKGKLAGVIMGMVDAVLLTLVLTIGLLAGNSEVDGMSLLMMAVMWFGPSIAVTLLGVRAIQKWNEGISHTTQRPGYQRQRRPNPAFAPAAGGGPYQQPMPQAHGQQPAPWPRQTPAAAPAEATAAMPSWKQSAVGLLHMAASIDPALSAARLVRARTAAAKLLGEAAVPRIQRMLARAVPVSDIEIDMSLHTSAIVAANNPRASEAIAKAALYVLAEGSSPLDDQFKQTMRAQLQLPG